MLAYSGVQTGGAQAVQSHMAAELMAVRGTSARQNAGAVNLRE